MNRETISATATLTKAARVLVLGAGPAGLGTAISLGEQATILEAGALPGGQSGSFELGGARFDWGGHSFHTPHPDVRELVFASLPMFEQKRDARCFAFDTLIPYPFQKHFRNLPDAAVVAQCQSGLQNAQTAAAQNNSQQSTQGAANFEEYLTARFGSGVARHFLLPYNRKLWGDLTRLDSHWACQRVAAPSAEKFENSGGARKPLQDDTSVAYPARGGFDEIWKALAQRVLDLRLGARAISIDVKTKRLALENGEVFAWENLVSTLPLDMLLHLIADAPNDLRRAASRLECLSLKLACAAIAHPVDTEVQRVYCADDQIAAHKIAVNHNSSDWLRALPRHGIMGEISCGPHKELPDDLEHHFVENLLQLGLISDREEVVEVKIFDIARAYPAPIFARNEIVSAIKSWLRARSIQTVGRFGEWDYINSDEALHRGLEVGCALRA